MIKFSFSVIGIFLISPLWAQTVTVQKQTAKIRSEQAEGFSTTLNAKKENVTGAWSKFLKEIGKTKVNGIEYQAITEPVIDGQIYPAGIVYGTIEGNDQSTRLWIGYLSTEWKEGEPEIIGKELEQMLYGFGVKFYRDQIQLQIDEAVKAKEAVERQTQRLISENKSLTNKLVNNEAQKMQLEKELKENELEHLVLQQKIMNNKKSQDSVQQATLQIQKVVEMHQERQRKVN